ncbi:hypothetical protein [Methanobrevibacter sp.]
MAIKKNYALTNLETEKIPDVNKILRKYATISFKSSSHIYFDMEPINNEVIEDMTFFQLEAEDETSLDEKFKELVNEIDQIIRNYAIRDETTGELLVYLKYVGELSIKFDNMSIIRQGTYEKIDELKNFKSEFGICRGYKPNFRVMEGKHYEKINNKPEGIYLLCHSQENLMKLKELLSEKIMEIDSDLVVDFTQFNDPHPENNTKFNLLDLERSGRIYYENLDED